MRIQYVKLHNIRSYKDAKIEFKEGSTLLLGDIGSGKSTILLAIEYAIFGFLKSESTGNAILRHGETSGSVDICFNIDKKEIIIRRELKRTQDGIIPSRCFLTIDGETEQLTSTELRERLFEILKYPRAIVSRNPTLIYRYTTYTPQEQLKEIIYDDPESRLDLLRRLFGIDKYKKILSNVDIYTSNLRGKVREYKGQIYDIEELRKQITEHVEKINILNSDKEKKSAEKEFVNKEYETTVKDYEFILEQVKKKENIKKETELLYVKLDENKKQSDKIDFLMDSSKKEIIDFESKIYSSIKTDEEIDIKKLNIELSQIESEYNKKKIAQEKNMQKKALFEKRNQDIKENITKKNNILLEKFSDIDEEKLLSIKEKNEILKKDTLQKKKEMENISEEHKKGFFKISTLMERSKEIEKKINYLENCPTCFQKVTSEHKTKIIKEEKERQKDYDSKITNYKETLLQLKKEQESIEETLLEIQKQEVALSRKTESLILKKQTLSDIQQLTKEQQDITENLKIIEQELKDIEDVNEIINKIKEKKKNIETAIEQNKKTAFQKNILEKIKIHKDMILNYEKNKETSVIEKKEILEKKNSLDLEIKKYDETENKELELSTKLKYYLDELKKKEIELASTEKDIENNKESLGKVTEKLEFKLNIEKEIEKINKIHDFLSKEFCEIVESIETKMMQRIYTVFNFLFKKWFSILIEDESIAVTLDENFNPKIFQNGYDTNIYNLSGGEKTSLALSYRLSLTKTINEILVNNTTSSLLILDEPTDGFSEQQLDRMRDVLDELDIKQIIIVSHESKIESFVNNIINISKKEHVSVIG